ncbi:MAG: hypothetical protein U0797_14960 [Gemmataceae bacterium]
MDLGRLTAERGDVATALKHLDEARRELTALAREAPGERRYAVALSRAYLETGRLLVRPASVTPKSVAELLARTAALRRAAEVIEQGKEVQAGLARLSNEPVTRAWLNAEVQHALLNARLLLGQRKFEQAERLAARALPMLEQLGKVGLGLDLTAERFRYETYLGVATASTPTRRDAAVASLRRALGLMKQLDVDPLPEGVAPRELGETTYLLAAALRNLKLPGEAVVAGRQAAKWQRAVQAVAPGDRDLRKELSRTLFELGGEYRETGAHAPAAEAARERAALWPDDADELHDVACELCMCARVASADQKARQAYHDEAIAVLGKAVAAGLKGAGSLRKDGDFTPLRDRPEFQKLVAEVERRDRQ